MTTYTEAHRRYKMSEQGKQNAKRWKQTPTGRESILRTRIKYTTSQKGTATIKRIYLEDRERIIEKVRQYKRTPEGKATQKRYMISEKGKASRKKYRTSDKAKQGARERYKKKRIKALAKLKAKYSHMKGKGGLQNDRV